MVEVGPYAMWMVWLGYIPIFSDPGGGHSWRPGGQAVRLAALVLLNLGVLTAYLYHLFLNAELSSLGKMLECIFKVLLTLCGLVLCQFLYITRTL